MIEDLVSVVMPSFNSSAFIGASIDSVLNQTFNAFELIVVDDGSEDDTCGIVEGYVKKDTRVRLIRCKNNSGAGPARNVAIDAAQGRFIAFLDSDDRWFSNKLAVQVGAMMSGQFALSCTGYRMLRADGRQKDVVPAERISDRDLLAGCDIGCLTAVMDTMVIGKKMYMPDIKIHEDYLLWINIIRQCQPALGIAEVLATLFIRDSSLSSSKLAAAKYQWIAYREELGLSFLQSSYYFSRYAIHGLAKHGF